MLDKDIKQLTKAQWHAHLIALTDTLLPDEEVKINADRKGNTKRITVNRRQTTILDLTD